MTPITPQMQAWLDERRKGIGGSDAAAVLSEGYGCPRSLFYDKTGVEPDYAPGEVTLGLYERGHALEPLIADKFTRETGLETVVMPSIVSEERPWMRVNVDRMIVPGPSHHERFQHFEMNGPGYLECKSANEHVFRNIREEGSPDHYVLQVQHGLAVTGWQWGAFAFKEPYTWAFEAFPFKRNDNLIDNVILPYEEAFWKMVKAGDIPDRLEDFSDSRCAVCVYRRGCRNSEALPMKAKVKNVYEPDTSEEVDVVVGNIKLLDAVIEDKQAEKEAEQTKLKILIGDRTAIAVPGQGKKFLYQIENAAKLLDLNALKAERPDVVEKYSTRLGEPKRVLRSYDMSEVPGLAEALKERA